jgi:hypothetical protein
MVSSNELAVRSTRGGQTKTTQNDIPEVLVKVPENPGVCNRIFVDNRP